LVGLLGLIGTPGHHLGAWPVDRVRQFGDRTGRPPDAVDPSRLANRLGTLSDLDPDQDPAATLHQAVQAATPLVDADAAGVLLADGAGAPRGASASDQRAQTVEANQERFGAGPGLAAFTSGRPAVRDDATMGAPLGGARPGHGGGADLFGVEGAGGGGGGRVGTWGWTPSEPRGGDPSEVRALAAAAGVVASLLGVAARAARRGSWPTSSRSPWTPGV
jgi:hypothetical protein